MKSEKPTYIFSQSVRSEILDQERERKHYSRCPVCGTPIRTRKMSNGGLVHFEAKTGLSHIKHSCLHPGEGLSARRDNNTDDLFNFREMNRDSNKD